MRHLLLIEEGSGLLRPSGILQEWWEKLLLGNLGTMYVYAQGKAPGGVLMQRVGGGVGYSFGRDKRAVAQPTRRVLGSPPTRKSAATTTLTVTRPDTSFLIVV